MDKIMTRDVAYETLQILIKNPSLVKHHLACEAAMREIGEYFKQKNSLTNVDDWAMVGLLHDADYELTHEHPQRHTIELEERIGKTLKPEVMYAIKAHNWKHTGTKPKSQMDWAIYTCDELTGIIIAATLIHPDKKLASVNADFILNRLKDKTFAKSVDRQQISACEKELGITLLAYVEMVLASMKKIADKLGL